MAPPTSSTPQKLPPTGPKALRLANGGPHLDRTTSANGGLTSPLGKISIAIPPPNAPSGPSSQTRRVPEGPRSNGFSVALPAESSRQALESVNRPPPPPPPRDPPPPPRSPSPQRRRKSRSPTKKDLAEDERFKASILPVEDVQRAKISISFGKSLPNGKQRPPPPHLQPRDDTLLRPSNSPTAQFFPAADPPISPKSERSVTRQPPSEPQTSPRLDRSRPTDIRPPSSPKRRPGLLGRRPATPPPPPDSAPPPPPPTSPKLRPGQLGLRPDTPPPPPSSAPPPPPSPPPLSRNDTSSQNNPSPPLALAPPPPTEPPDLPAPPSFHFRNLPEPSKPVPPSFHFRQLPDREESDGDSSDEEPAPRIQRSPPPHLRPSRQSSPKKVPSRPPSPPWIPAEYAPPASAFRRVNSGSYVLVGVPSKPRGPGREEKKPASYRRYDGVEQDGTLVEPSDPRRKSNAWKRGVGPAAQISKYYAINYQWDEETSVGSKPPSPPEAVLITGLSPLTTADQIRKFLAPHGRVRELDVKMDKKSGSQLGICWVKFEASRHGKNLSAHEVAKWVCKVCDGQRISLMADEKIKLVLDGRGLRAAKAVKEEMERKYAPKRPEIKVASMPTSAGGGGETPITLPPRPVSKPMPPKPVPVPFHRALPVRAWQPMRNIAPPRPAATQHLSSSFTDRPFEPRPNRFERDRYKRRDSVSSRSDYSSRSRSRGRYSSDYSSDDDYYRRRQRSPLKRRLVQKDEVKERKEDIEEVERALKNNGHPALFVDGQSVPTINTNEGVLHDHFKHFRPSQILRLTQGWYLLFTDDTTAARAMTVLDRTRINGRQIVMSLKNQASRHPAAIAPAAGADRRWRFLSITKKNKAIPARVLKPLREPSPSSEDEAPVQRKPARVALPSESPPPQPTPPEPPAKVEPIAIIEKLEPEQIVEAEIVVQPKKRKAKAPPAKAVKKARVEAVALPPIVQPEVAEIKVEPAVKAKLTPLDKLIADGIIEDEEDAYWLGQVFADEAVEEEEPVLFAEDHPLHHLSGSWRAEGWKKIPKTQKSHYLPQRNRAAAAAEEAGALTTGRTARITGRRLVQDMDTHRKTTAATLESDLFAFNQLRIRKKQLKFARSAIEGYGLYAMETIQPGEMVCEYVGELVRSSVADLREHQYLKQGIGSSYLFRIDGDVVCDATFRGSVRWGFAHDFADVSRLINHSCDPSANAKIISINGQSKIVIYAKRMLHPGEEILYDYKFPLESDPALRVPCLCGAATCRGWLN